VAKQRGDLHRFFERLFELEQRYEDESLVKYGLKVLSSQIIKKPNWGIMEAYLLKCGHAFPNTLQTIVRIFETYQFHGYAIDTKAATRFCNTVIKQHSVSDGHSEIAWTLWLALKLKLIIDKEAVDSVQATSNSVCLIVLLDMQTRKLTKAKVSTQILKQFANAAALISENWLLAYEGGRRMWLNNKNVDFIIAHNHFGSLLENDVQFYDETIPITPLFVLKENLPPDFQIEPLWDSDDDIDEFFDFDELGQDYSDDGPEGDINQMIDSEQDPDEDWEL